MTTRPSGCRRPDTSVTTPAPLPGRRREGASAIIGCAGSQGTIRVDGADGDGITVVVGHVRELSCSRNEQSDLRHRSKIESPIALGDGAIVEGAINDRADGYVATDSGTATYVANVSNRP